jgi:hypothetical protein
LLPRTDLRVVENRLLGPRVRRGLVAAAITVAAPLALISVMGNRPAQPSPDPQNPLRAELSGLEQQVLERAADVAVLRMMAERARTELSALRDEKAAEQAALADLKRPPVAADDVPGVNQPFYRKPPRPPEVVVNAHRNPRTARDYLLAARKHIADGRSRDARAALEMAETRALNDSSWRVQDLRRARIVRQISDARRLLGSGDTTRTVQLIESASQSVR